MSSGREFWLTSGFHLLERDPAGRLRVTDGYLRAYLDRPELRPEPTACAEERALHEALLETPRQPIAMERLARIADPDARENWRIWLDFRDRLLAQPSLETFYLSLFRSGSVAVPPLFIDQLVHAMLRGILDGCVDPVRLRAAELLFRAQSVSLENGAIMLADEETLEMHAAARRSGSPGGLLAGAGAPVEVELDVMTEANADGYWARSDRFDMVLDASFARPAIDALCRVLEAWVRHFLGAEVAIAPVQRISDERWIWHVGLDRVASGILNDLYEGRSVNEPRLAQLLGLFRLELREPAALLPGLAGRPVYLAMAMDERRRLRLKPQNLLVNLPLAQV